MGTRRRATVGLFRDLTCVVCLGLAHVAAARADQLPEGPLKELGLEALGNVEVTSVSKEPEAVRLTPAAIYVITQEDIRRSGATTLPEVLRLAPGLDVARIDSDHWSVGVRGFGDQFSKAVLVLIDGRSVYTPLFAGVFWAAQDVQFEDIDRVEVIRGPGGTIWGANAVNGVVNVITKNTQLTHGGLASAGGGTVDRAVGTFRFGGRTPKNLDYRLYAKGFSRGPSAHADGVDYDDWRMAQSGGRVDWRGQRDTVMIQGSVFDGKDGQMVARTSLSPPAQTIDYAALDVSGGNLVAQWRRDYADRSDVQVLAYYDRTYFLDPNIGETRNTFDVDFIHHVAATSRHDLIWGIGARHSESDIIQTVPTFDLAPHEQPYNIYSAFVQDEVPIVRQKLWLTVGSKFERNSYTGLEVQPTARILWTGGGRHSFWAAATRAVRTPSRLEEDVQVTQFARFLPSGIPAFIRLTGNREFESERLVGSEAGYRSAVLPQLYVDVSVFYNHFDSLQSYGPQTQTVEGAPTRLVVSIPYGNGVQGESEGIEIAPDWKPTRWLQLKAFYSYLRIDVRNKPNDTDPGNFVLSYEGSSPRHQLVVRPSVTWSRGWELDSTWRYVSALPARQVGAYATADVRLGWHVDRHFEWSLAAQNLLDDKHLEFSLSLGPPVAVKRTVYTSITWRR
jgi:iron complex outermembrane receptor protein